MELRQLQCFVECARTQSFSQAAALLFTTQSNVSKMIAALEEECGQKLFVRKQRGITLTEKGRQIYQYALNIVDCSAKLMECMEEKRSDELRISLQSSNWLAIAFVEYFVRNPKSDVHYYLKNATVDEIIRRISGNVDQLGFAYIEKHQLARLKEVFRTNHIDYVILKATNTVLCYGGKSVIRLPMDSEPDGGELMEFPLIQGFDDEYSGTSYWRKQLNFQPRIRITTDSDYVMKEILQRTELSVIGPGYLNHPEGTLRPNEISLSGEKNNILYVCMFRDDRELEPIPSHFLEFLKQYISEESEG